MGTDILRFEVRKKLIALTFDDGPNPPFTEAILDILKNYGARATFFCVGRQIEAHRSVVRRAFAEGHQIGNHSYRHSDMSVMSYDAIKIEIESTDRLIREIVGDSNIPFRAPYARESPTLTSYLSETNRPHFLFDVSPPPDYDHNDPMLISAFVATHARRGSVVVLHDGGEEQGANRSETVQATEYIVAGFSAKGFKFASVSSLLEDAELSRCAIAGSP